MRTLVVNLIIATIVTGVFVAMLAGTIAGNGL
jgi:hypothetical protein